MDLNEYLKRFYVLAGSANNVYGFKGILEYQKSLVELANSVIKTYISDETATHYREILNYVSTIEIMIAMIKRPDKFWVAPSKVLTDLRDVEVLLNNAIAKPNVFFPLLNFLAYFSRFTLT